MARPLHDTGSSLLTMPSMKITSFPGNLSSKIQMIQTNMVWGAILFEAQKG